MTYVRIIALTALVLSTFGAASQEAKPRSTKDGFPAGIGTPEGAATDLARAFIQRDANLFLRTSIAPYGAGQSRAAYAQYLAGQSDALRRERARSTYSLDNPRAINRVFAARHLSRNGPASYGYASFDFKEVLFVDVEVILNDGASYVKRTLVIQVRDGKWYAHPKPDLSPLLSMGLDDETPSTKIVAVSR